MADTPEPFQLDATVADPATFEDKSVPLASLYVPDPENEGQHVLNVGGKGPLQLVNATNLRKALETERGSVGDLKRDLAAAREQLDGYKGEDGEFWDPDSVRAALEAAESGKKIDRDAIYQEIERKLGKAHQKALEAADAERSAAVERADKIAARYQDDVVDREIDLALREAGGSPKLRPIVKAALRVGLTEEGGLDVAVLDEDGDPRYHSASGGQKPWTIKDQVRELSQDSEWSGMFTDTAASNGGGGTDPHSVRKPATTGSGPERGQPPYVISREDQRNPEAYERHRQKAVAAGRPIKLEW